MLSLYCNGQNVKSSRKNSIGIHLSLNGFVPFINYDLELTKTNAFSLNSSIHVIYDWKADILFFPLNVYLKYGNKFKVYSGIGIGNYVDFSPFPKTKIERDNWMPDGGQWISYPYNIRPDFVIGLEYNFNRIVLSLSSFNILYWYRNYSVPDYIMYEPKNSIKPVFLLGVNYKF